MIATARQDLQAVQPGVGSEPAAYPRFHIHFSPAEASFSASATNSFQWVGKGLLSVQERGIVVHAKRTFLLGLRLNDDRFVPRTEIKEVYREGNLVRVHLRGRTSEEPFFQFWTANASTASTIVRLLPTNRTIEYEATGAAPLLAPVSGPTTRPADNRALRSKARIWITFAVVLCGLASLLIGRMLVDHQVTTSKPALSGATRAQPSAALRTNSSAGSPSKPVYSIEEITAARQELDRFMPQLDRIEIEFGTQCANLQNGWLSRQDFMLYLEHRLLPRLDAMRVALGTGSPPPLSLRATVRARLDEAALQWGEAAVLYVRGLQEEDHTIVARAFRRIGDAEMSEHNAERLVNQPH